MRQVEKFLRNYDVRKISNYLLAVVAAITIISLIFDFKSLILFFLLFVAIDVSVTLMVLEEKKDYIARGKNVCLTLLTSYLWLYVNSYIVGRIFFPHVNQAIYMIVLFIICIYISGKIDEKVKEK